MRNTVVAMLTASTLIAAVGATPTSAYSQAINNRITHNHSRIHIYHQLRINSPLPLFTTTRAGTAIRQRTPAITMATTMAITGPTGGGNKLSRCRLYHQQVADA
jgi:hypothetical protein